MALILLVDATAEEARDQGRRAREARQEAARRQVRAAAEERQGGDYFAVMVVGALAITVLGPYLIGHLLMTKTFVLKPDPAVYEQSLRGLWDHFWPTYLAGLVPILLILAAFLLLRTPWEGRRGSVIIGGVALVGCLAVVLPYSMSLWHQDEMKTAAKLRETAFPFSDRFYTCGGWDFRAENGIHEPELWQVYLAQVKGFDGKECNRVNVYRGWQYVGVYTLPGGDTFTGEIRVNHVGWDHDISADHSTTFYQTDGKTHEVTPMNPVATNVDLPTERGMTLTFSLDGAGSNGFTLH
ncbi:hypothetical protein ACQ86B_29135 (plasmid) [Mycolicibacterium aichiense]|uniref:hypothetical protein n=1 Tax=Mycolicibacterium aichiense TaxID=1799 RepID=UPI003D66B558